MSLEQLFEAAEVLENRHLLAWRERGRGIVGITCAAVPGEILHAAGLLPFRLRGHGAVHSDIGDTYFGPFICSLPKCVLQLAGESRLRFLDGVIVTPGCDSMRRLDECWRAAGDDHPGIVPELFFHLGVPHKHTDYSVRWFADELRRLLHALRSHFDVTLTDDDLAASIRLFNRSRARFDRLEQLRAGLEAPISGAEALAVTVASGAIPRERWIELVDELLVGRRDGDAGRSHRIRLMLLGSASDDLELLRLIEGDRAVVVADNLCFGSRAQLAPVAEGDDPLLALADRYLAHTDCPRFFGGYPDRRARVLEHVRRAQVDGVILQNIRFCDLHGAENGLLERDLEQSGVPCLRLEREYGPLVETGRIRLRVEALLERIEARRQVEQGGVT